MREHKDDLDQVERDYLRLLELAHEPDEANEIAGDLKWYRENLKAV